jgi:hypothetical protein
MVDDVNAQVGELALRLFELRAAQEADLRALTWIQQSLEGIRCGNGFGDTDLLLGEMARRFMEADAASAAIDLRRQAAIDILGRVINQRRVEATPKPLAIVAA